MGLNAIFNDLVDFLTPFMGDRGSRYSILTQALIGNPVLQQINYEGDARTFVVAMLQKLQTYDEKAIGEVLKTLRRTVGVDKQERIDGFLAALARSDDAPKPGGEKGSVIVGPGGERPPGPINKEGRRWAVLVGVNEYEDEYYSKLRFCINDVCMVRDQLIAGGFDADRIVVITDDTQGKPTAGKILSTLRNVAGYTRSEDTILFYYSGHGDDGADDESYLIAHSGYHNVLGDTALPISRVKKILLEEAPARAKVMILDACKSGANIGRKGPKLMTEEFIRRVFKNAEGVAILSSSKQGELSYEWEERNLSAFTYYLLEALKGGADWDQKGFVTVQDASRYVLDGVEKWVVQRGWQQTPTFQASMVGDIILADVKL
ncbi:MAG: caspase family protein [Anaerolineae bacterium]|nr:caspase family protein [Anaerolineae bacterium]